MRGVSVISISGLDCNEENSLLIVLSLTVLKNYDDFYLLAASLDLYQGI